MVFSGKIKGLTLERSSITIITWAGSILDLKYYIGVEVNDNNKHSSLLSSEMKINLLGWVGFLKTIYDFLWIIVIYHRKNNSF